MPAVAKSFLRLAFWSVVFLTGLVSRSEAQPANLTIDWEVPNRFRLFKNEADFRKHVEAHQSAHGSVLKAEQKLANDTHGNGWARDLGALCFDRDRGRIEEACRRDGVTESYFNPLSHLVRMLAKLPSGWDDAQCSWVIGSGKRATILPSRPCNEPLEFRFSNKRESPVDLIAQRNDGSKLRASSKVRVKDYLVVGMGDSLASGEGNPERPARLADNGFCFRRLTSGTEFFVPSRAGEGFTRACPSPGEHPDEREAYEEGRAHWLYGSCHRSLYGYQARTALALAVENRHAAVTYVPLGCTGATIAQGLLGSQPARERFSGAPRDVVAQITQLGNYIGDNKKRPVFRTADLLLLTIGANDVGFSGLVAHVMVADNADRWLLKRAGMIVTPTDADKEIPKLRRDFSRLREQLRVFVAGDLGRVVFVPYANPAQHDGGATCPTAWRGFDIHPSFQLDGNKAAETSDFVEVKLTPTLKDLATCSACSRSKRMQFVEDHRQEFSSHGFCASAASDPEFDRACFRNGGSFAQLGLETPLTCPRSATEFRAYASRARWIRTANDSTFAAPTFAASLPRWLQALDIHDAIGGLTSVVYGGAIHPTAEGHAAMADAALVHSRRVLGTAP